EIPDSPDQKDNKHGSDRMERIADDYVSKTPSEREKTLIITLTNAERIQQNAIIRDKLAHQGELYGDPQVAQVLVARKLTQTELTRASNYCVGDRLRFNSTMKNCGIEKGQYTTVTGIHPKQNMLELVNEAGKKVIWKLPHFSADTHVGV